MNKYLIFCKEVLDKGHTAWYSGKVSEKDLFHQLTGLNKGLEN